MSKFWTLHPALFIHSKDSPLSKNVSTSIFSKSPSSLAQSQIFLTELNSPTDTLAEAISILSIDNSLINNFEIVSFSEAEKETPDVCSPSLRWCP